MSIKSDSVIRYEYEFSPEYNFQRNEIVTLLEVIQHEKKKVAEDFRKVVEQLNQSEAERKVLVSYIAYKINNSFKARVIGEQRRRNKIVKDSNSK